MIILVLIVLAVIFASNVKATVTIPEDEITFTRRGGDYSARVGPSNDPVVQQIPTLGNTLPGAPTFGPEEGPTDRAFSQSLYVDRVNPEGF